MANVIKVKNSVTTTNVPTGLVIGELAVNAADGKLFTSNAAGNATIELTNKAIWGNITGTLASQTDLQSALTGKSDTSHSHTLDGLSDVIITTPATDQILKYNGTNWVNGTASGGGADTRIASFPATPAANPTVAGTTATTQLAIGDGAVVAGNNNGSIAIGKSYSSGVNSIAIGQDFSTVTYGASGAQSVAIGYASKATMGSSIAIGNQAAATGGSGSIAIGHATISVGQNVVIGHTASASAGDESVAIGKNSKTVFNGVTIGTGTTNTSAQYTVAIGSGCNATGDLGSIAIGYSTTATAGRGTTAIGRQVVAGQTRSFVTGFNTNADMPGEFVFGAGCHSAAGDAKNSMLCARIITTDATVTEVKLSTTENTGNPTGVITLTNDSTYLFDCDIVARNTATDTESAAWNLKFAIRRGAAAANTALIGTAVKTIFGQDTGTTTWDVSVTADTTNGRPNISVTGEAAKTIRWVANIRMTKVSG